MNAKIAVQFQEQPRQNFLADLECAIERAAQPKIDISTKHRQRKARKAWFIDFYVSCQGGIKIQLFLQY